MGGSSQEARLTVGDKRAVSGKAKLSLLLFTTSAQRHMLRSLLSLPLPRAPPLPAGLQQLLSPDRRPAVLPSLMPVPSGAHLDLWTVLSAAL